MIKEELCKKQKEEGRFNIQFCISCHYLQCSVLTEQEQSKCYHIEEAMSDTAMACD